MDRGSPASVVIVARLPAMTSAFDMFAPVCHSARNRSPWLFRKLVTAFAATRFIGLFESTTRGRACS